MIFLTAHIEGAPILCDVKVSTTSYQEYFQSFIVICLNLTYGSALLYGISISVCVMYFCFLQKMYIGI
jgi:hypothetical protein